MMFCILAYTVVCEISGQVYMECGTACPAVCGEENVDICTLQCVSGCQCPLGTILDRKSAQCVTECPLRKYAWEYALHTAMSYDNYDSSI